MKTWEVDCGEGINMERTSIAGARRKGRVLKVAHVAWLHILLRSTHTSIKLESRCTGMHQMGVATVWASIVDRDVRCPLKIEYKTSFYTPLNDLPFAWRAIFGQTCSHPAVIRDDESWKRAHPWTVCEVWSLTFSAPIVKDRMTDRLTQPWRSPADNRSS